MVARIDPVKNRRRVIFQPPRSQLHTAASPEPRLTETENGMGKHGRRAKPLRARQDRPGGEWRRAKPRQPDRDVENSARFRDVASIQAAKNQIVATGSMEFDFGGHRVRAVLRGDEAWFAAADVCVALDHTKSKDGHRSLGR